MINPPTHAIQARHVKKRITIPSGRVHIFQVRQGTHVARTVWTGKAISPLGYGLPLCWHGAKGKRASARCGGSTLHPSWGYLQAHFLGVRAPHQGVPVPPPTPPGRAWHLEQGRALPASPAQGQLGTRVLHTKFSHWPASALALLSSFSCFFLFFSWLSIPPSILKRQDTV